MRVTKVCAHARPALAHVLVRAQALRKRGACRVRVRACAVHAHSSALSTWRAGAHAQGIVNLVRTLRKRGVAVYIISGGFRQELRGAGTRGGWQRCAGCTVHGKGVRS